jgi:hypothetical protein
VLVFICTQLIFTSIFFFIPVVATPTLWNPCLDDGEINSVAYSHKMVARGIVEEKVRRPLVSG